MLEDDLKAMMAAPRNMAFTLGVMARIERRQFRRALIANVALALAAAALLALTVPMLQQAWLLAFAPRVDNALIAALLLGASYLGLRFVRTER